MTRPDSVFLGKQPIAQLERKVEGELVDYDGERFYRILQAEGMKPFFMTIVSDSDHWLFGAERVELHGRLRLGQCRRERGAAERRGVRDADVRGFSLVHGRRRDRFGEQ